MSVKTAIIRKAFGGRPDIFRNCIIKTTTGAPDTANKVGALCWNSADSDAYICTVAAGTWVKINA